MGARTDIKNRLPGRHMTGAPSRAPADQFDLAEIFKKTPDVAGLKPRGRDVAKDMREIGGLPLLMKTLLDNGHLHGDCITVTGRTIAEDLKSVKWNPRQDRVRGAPDGAISEVAAMLKLKIAGPAARFDRGERTAASGLIGLLRGGDIVEIGAEALNVKLTRPRLTKQRTKWKARATNHRSSALGKYAQQVGPALDGAVTHPDGAHEKQCYADM